MSHLPKARVLVTLFDKSVLHRTNHHGVHVCLLFREPEFINPAVDAKGGRLFKANKYSVPVFQCCAVASTHVQGSPTPYAKQLLYSV